MNNPVKMKAKSVIVLILFLGILNNSRATQKSQQLGQPLIQLSHGELSIWVKFYFTFFLAFGSSISQRFLGL